MIWDKKTERKRLRDTLRATLPEERAAWSAAMRRRLRESRFWNTAQTVMLFAAMRYEPDLLPLLEDEKCFVFPSLEQDAIVPRITGDPGDLILVPHGIREPDMLRCAIAPVREIDLILVPGLGFGSDGTRLGRGRGHFDRFLATLPETTLRCGVCFARQVSPSLPAEPHDVPMHQLLTEEGLEDCGGTSALPRSKISA